MTPFAIFLASEHHIKLTVRKHGIGTADISFVAGASPRSFDWGGGDSGALNPPSTKFWFLFLDFRSLVLKILKIRKNCKYSDFSCKNGDFWETSPPEF